MLDVISRALRHPLDYFPVVNRHTLTLQEVIHETGDIYSFIFIPEKPLRWKAGQHGIFMFPKTKVEGKFWRAFSIASSSNEKHVRISTIISDTPSSFKKQLQQMKQGEKIIMQGPFGEFHTRRTVQQIVGIAGGIGITPFRALLYDIANGYITNTKITLIYSAKNNDYAYKNELAAWAQFPNIEIIFNATPEEVNADLQAQIKKHKNTATYFISGSPGMIKALRTSCKQQGIIRIVNDTFKGY